MTGVLLVVVIFLGIVTFGNVLLLFAVIRRLRYLQELAMPPAPVPTIGTAVEPFQIETTDHAILNEDAFGAGPVLVIALSTTCPACQDVAGRLASLRPQVPSPLVIVVTASQQEAVPLLQMLADVGRIAVIGKAHPALRALGGIAAFPTVLVIAQNKIVSSGINLDEALPVLGENPHVTAR
ncbi:MAG: hypothetical protein ACRDOL_25450 [Streptosporangiaceae bacterium]